MFSVCAILIIESVAVMVALSSSVEAVAVRQ